MSFNKNDRRSLLDYLGYLERLFHNKSIALIRDNQTQTRVDCVNSKISRCLLQRQNLRSLYNMYLSNFWVSKKVPVDCRYCRTIGSKLWCRYRICRICLHLWVSKLINSTLTYFTFGIKKLSFHCLVLLLSPFGRRSISIDVRMERP